MCHAKQDVLFVVRPWREQKHREVLPCDSNVSIMEFFKCSAQY